MPPIILNVVNVEKVNKRDWLIHKNIEVKGYKQIIDNIINQIEPVDLSEYSTCGFNSVQYGLLDYQDLFLEIQERVVSEIHNPIKEYSNSKVKLTDAWTVLGYENSYHTAHSHLKTLIYYHLMPLQIDLLQYYI